MYTANPPTPTPGFATWPRQATLCPPWWTIPEAYRLQMHAFTRPSHQLRQKARAATLRNLHHTSIYMRLILQAKEQGATTATTGTALHTRLRDNSKEGTYLLKFSHGQPYTLESLSKDTDMPRMTSVPYVTARTHAHTSQENANSTKTSQSTATTRHANSYTRRFKTPQRGEAHYILQTAYAL